MHEFRPSRYIQNSEYATIKTYEPITASIAIPETITTDAYTDIVYSADLDLPTTQGIAWRAIVESTKFDNGVNTPSFLVACKANEMGYDFDTYFYGEVVRISPTQVQLRLVFAPAHLDTITYSECGQTFTIKLQPYLSPFDA